MTSVAPDRCSLANQPQFVTIPMACLPCLANQPQFVTIPMACFPCLSSSKDHVECMGKVGLDLVMLYRMLNQVPSPYDARPVSNCSIAPPLVSNCSIAPPLLSNCSIAPPLFLTAGCGTGTRWRKILIRKHNYTKCRSSRKVTFFNQ